MSSIGLEPTTSDEVQILSLLCLPISPRRPYILYIFYTKQQIAANPNKIILKLNIPVIHKFLFFSLCK